VARVAWKEQKKRGNEQHFLALKKEVFKSLCRTSIMGQVAGSGAVFSKAQL
jgi:hypothetical protein